MIWDFEITFEKHGKGPYHGKDKNKATKERRARSNARLPAKKDRNVARSSHGMFLTVDDLMNGVRQR